MIDGAQKEIQGSELIKANRVSKGVISGERERQLNQVAEFGGLTTAAAIHGALKALQQRRKECSDESTAPKTTTTTKARAAPQAMTTKAPTAPKTMTTVTTTTKARTPPKTTTTTTTKARATPKTTTKARTTPRTTTTTTTTKARTTSKATTTTSKTHQTAVTGQHTRDSASASASAVAESKRSGHSTSSTSSSPAQWAIARLEATPPSTHTSHAMRVQQLHDTQAHSIMTSGGLTGLMPSGSVGPITKPKPQYHPGSQYGEWFWNGNDWYCSSNDSPPPGYNWQRRPNGTYEAAVGDGTFKFWPN